MAATNWILDYRRFLKRRNCSKHTVKNYLNTLKHFAIWLDVPIEQVTNKKVLAYIDFLLDRNLKPKTINCHLVTGVNYFFPPRCLISICYHRECSEVSQFFFCIDLFL